MFIYILFYKPGVIQGLNICLRLVIEDSYVFLWIAHCIDKVSLLVAIVPSLCSKITLKSILYISSFRPS